MIWVTEWRVVQETLMKVVIRLILKSKGIWKSEG